MPKRHTLSLTVSLLLSLSFWSPGYLLAYGTEKMWLPAERAALPGSDQLLSVPLDPGDQEKGSFYLYYFTVKKTTTGDNEKPYILFVAGGPGEVIFNLNTGTGPLDFLSEHYNIVYFHLRGSGFSQLSPSNRFDRFLRTRYAVEDIEEIRRNLGENIQWHAVVGESYGTVLVQQYAALYPDKVTKTILIAPLSRSGLSSASWQDLSQAMRNKRVDILKRIYNSDLFENCLPQHTIDFTIQAVRKISDKIDEEFGNLGLITVAYDLVRPKLQDLGLDYEPQFFRALRMLRQIGWLPLATKMRAWMLTSIQTAIGWQLAFSIAKALHDENRDPYSLPPVEMLQRLRNAHCKQTIPVSRWLTDFQDFSIPQPHGSQRAYYVMWNYDGLNPALLHWLQQGDDFATALLKSSGRARANPYVGKIGILPDVIPSPWDPMLCKHNRPTLIIKGGADPVTVQNQPEYILNNALSGSRMLIEFPGVGHAMVLPTRDLPQPIGGAGPCGTEHATDSTHMRTRVDLKKCLLYSFVARDFQAFQKDPFMTQLRNTFAHVCAETRHCLNITIKPASVPPAPPRSSPLCPFATSPAHEVTPRH